MSPVSGTTTGTSSIIRVVGSISQLAEMETALGDLLIRCNIELDGLPPSATAALVELVEFIGEGLALAAQAQKPAAVS